MGSLMGLWLLLAAFAANAGFDPLAELPGAQPVGTGKLTWLGMTVYQATLYAPDGVYQPERPHALRIRYEFSFSRESLARTTLQEIERMHGTLRAGAQLVQRLSAVFRDVGKGDQITGVHHPGEGAVFYSTESLLGRLDDPVLASAFFDIWLDPRTREPDLRKQLLGLAP
ncbi:MAG: chalcone isomerase family protein [Pseudomonadota bacterium]